MKKRSAHKQTKRNKQVNNLTIAKQKDNCFSKRTKENNTMKQNRA